MGARVPPGDYTPAGGRRPAIGERRPAPMAGRERRRRFAVS